MKNVTIGVLVVALIVVGYFAFVKETQSPTVDMDKNSDSGEFILSASFSCTDGTKFVAEFAEANKVNILVDGNLTKTLPLVADAGRRFEDNSHVYVFAGEEVSVTTKANNKTTTCSQPVDPNNAPANFGDAGEGSGEKQDVVMIVSESIVGKYQSTTDAKFTREFKNDGTVVDMYGADKVSTGTWKVFTSESGLSVGIPLVANTTYVQLKMSGSQAETLNFKISKLTPEGLDLVYMDKGGVLMFIRVN